MQGARVQIGISPRASSYSWEAFFFRGDHALSGSWLTDVLVKHSGVLADFAAEVLPGLCLAEAWVKRSGILVAAW